MTHEEQVEAFDLILGLVKNQARLLTILADDITKLQEKLEHYELGAAARYYSEEVEKWRIAQDVYNAEMKVIKTKLAALGVSGAVHVGGVDLGNT